MANKIKRDKKLTFKVGAAENPNVSRTFDIIFFANSFHFVKEFDKAMENLVNLLKEKGIVLVIEPSQEPVGWADPVLNKDSESFDSDMFQKKLRQLIKAEEYLKENKYFKIIGQISGRSNMYLLTKK